MKTKTSISIRQSDLIRLQKIAKREKRSVSSLIEIAVEETLKAKPIEQKRKERGQSTLPK